jgi:hypothetical protein
MQCLACSAIYPMACPAVVDNNKAVVYHRINGLAGSYQPKPLCPSCTRRSGRFDRYQVARKTCTRPELCVKCPQYAKCLTIELIEVRALGPFEVRL